MRIFFAIFCMLFSFSSIAANSRDSIGVENQNGSQIILHKVERKETYYSIGRLYNVSPTVIINQNKNIALQTGLILKVPTTRPYSQTGNTSNPRQPDNNTAIDYRVGPREYLYAIAKRFNTTIEEIKRLNNLKSENLRIGQILKIPQAQTTPQIVMATPAAAETPTQTEVIKPKIPTSRLGLSEQTERGVAIWIADENLDGTKMLALHRTAPVGTVVKITNPMTDRVTFVKVVGKFTENESTRDVIIVITKATADLLGVLDKRFQATIDYGTPNE